MDEIPYNPLDKRNLGDNVAEALLERPVCPLPPTDSFVGAGIYAIYYVGSHKPYLPIASRNREEKFASPIYIGKAIPAGARKGGLGLDLPAGQVLFNRLKEHADSISQSSNLLPLDFFCRFLVVDDIWIPLGEALLIERFMPIWNRVIDGFGNHDPGKGRYLQQRSPWDVLHPGRAWADRCAASAKTEENLLIAIQEHLQSLDFK